MQVCEHIKLYTALKNCSLFVLVNGNLFTSINKLFFVLFYLNTPLQSITVRSLLEFCVRRVCLVSTHYIQGQPSCGIVVY